MCRAVAMSLAVCLCLATQETFAQGLLGKGHASGQYLAVRFDNDEFPGLDDVHHGWRTQLNMPLVWAEREDQWSLGVDVFGTLSGLRVDGELSGAPPIDVDIDFLIGDAGFNIFTNATEHIRPFAQFGLNWTQIKGRATDGVTTLETRDAQTTALLGAGVEVDLWEFLAVRASVVFDAESIDNTEFVGELFLRPGDQWFGRFTVQTDTDGDLLGGIGLGVAW